jgi:hypothetical protein
MKDKKWCMSFSNSEIQKFIIDKLDYNVDCKYIVDDNYVERDSKKDFEYVTFDGEKQEFYISFLKRQTSIFFFNSEIMFIDDNEKKNYTISDVYGNIVYEGKLNDLSHEQLLTKFCTFINLLYKAENIEVIQKPFPKQDGNYPRYNYRLKVYKKYCENCVYCFDNIEVEVVQKQTN